MSRDPVQNVIIVGGGTAGWMTAAMLSKVLSPLIKITLIESEAIGTVGVGEATIPPIQAFNSALGLDENEFLRETKATFKLGIQFENWRDLDTSYIHTFGASGQNQAFCAFHHHWKRAQSLGHASNYWSYDLNYLACKAMKFTNEKPRSIHHKLPYAYHFDATLYGLYLRKYSEQMGVQRVEGLIQNVSHHPQTGHIQSVTLQSGQSLEGDLFIDCSGARGLLIKQALNIDYEDWSHWLPCDRAVAIPSESSDPIPPYTRSIAHTAGWQWQIPLQHRNGNGLVYSSAYYEDERAADTLLSHLGTTPAGDPKFIKFQTGRTVKQWHKNVISVGLSSGFLEPLESTSIYLIQSAIVRLLHLFPHFLEGDELENEYNRQSKIEYELIRDFIILHYHQQARTDSPFWKELREMSIPDRLAHKISLFAAKGELTQEQYDIFLEPSWVQVMMGQGLIPKDYHPLANKLAESELLQILAQERQRREAVCDAMPTHSASITNHMPSSP